jgi:hypothetical protein
MENALALLAGFLLFFVIIFVIIYVVGALVFMKLGQKAGVANSWVAWVPFGQWYVQAAVAGLPSLIWLAPIGIAFASNFTEGFVALLFSLLLLAYIIFVDMKIFARFGENPKLAFLHFIPVIGSLIVFIKMAILAFGNAQAERYI